MPRYYFDFTDRKSVWRDGEGIDFSEPKSACDEMRLTMLKMAKELKDLAAQDGKLKLVGVVRDRRKTIWRGQLLFEEAKIA